MTTPFNVRPDSWARISALLDVAFDLDAGERAALLAKTTAEDAELGAELARLLPAIDGDTMATSVPNAAPFTSLLNLALVKQAANDSTGATFGAWTLTEKIGQGGMGEVWRALRSDGLFQGAAAIKILRSDLPADKLAARFARERAVLARLNHPNIARLLDAGVASNLAFIVLELVQGLPLLSYAAASAPTVADRVRLIRDLTRAVEHAHSQLVLHRDLKPSNVLVTENGTAKLLDFGIAAALDEASQNETTPNLTQLTGRGLTLEYAAPEQILGEPTVAASDVYSLGAMLFHLLTGQRPFAGNANRAALEYAAVHTEAPRASASVVLPSPPGERGQTSADQIAPPKDTAKLKGDLDAIISKALRKSPAERYATASAFAADLDAWLAQTPISIRAEDRSYRSRLWFRRNCKLAALGATAALAIVAGLGVSTWQRSVAVANAAIARDEAARASKVADYLGELIESASPDKHGGNWPSVLALLEQSEKDLAAQFKDDPKTHAMLLKRMLDTNDALNRDTVAFAQSQQLDALLASIEPLNVELQLDTRRQQGWLLRRLGRYDEALALDQQTLAGFAVHYGKNSVEYAKFLNGQGSTLMRLGRFDEAGTKLDEGYALLEKLQPDNLKNRLDAANDKTVLLTQQNRWREAAETLAAMEPIFKTVADSGGKELRDVLIMRNNLEAIRIRLGRYENTDERLQKIAADGSRLLGADNMISLKSQSLQTSNACETGAFSHCLQRYRTYFEAIKRRVGVEPSELVEAELDLRSTELLLQQVEPSAGRDALQRLTAAIAQTLPTASVNRSYLYRIAADAAIRAGDIELASRALNYARADLLATKATASERIAQADRAEAAIAFARGDAARAVTLLGARFRADEAVKENATPRHATLWLQRAIYEVQFDSKAAALSLAQSRATYERAGGAQPQFKALIHYIDARIAGNAETIRLAEDAVDRAYLRTQTRTNNTPWHVPHLSSL